MSYVKRTCAECFDELRRHVKEAITEETGIVVPVSKKYKSSSAEIAYDIRDILSHDDQHPMFIDEVDLKVAVRRLKTWKNSSLGTVSEISGREGVMRRSAVLEVTHAIHLGKFTKVDGALVLAIQQVVADLDTIQIAQN